MQKLLHGFGIDLPIWMHPARGADVVDYKGEKKSHYEIWWTFGWPYETSAAMAHMVFEGLFDKHPGLKVITHHMGGMVPYFEGRVGPGWDQLGTRTSDEDYRSLLKSLKKRPLDYFRMFYADTALFGASDATAERTSATGSTQPPCANHQAGCASTTPARAPASSAASAIARVPSTLLRKASRNCRCSNGTCLYAAAWKMTFGRSRASTDSTRAACFTSPTRKRLPSAPSRLTARMMASCAALMSWHSSTNT